MVCHFVSMSSLSCRYFKKHESGIAVVGCPKTIDGDLKNEHVHVSFGFDTACRLCVAFRIVL